MTGPHRGYNEPGDPPTARQLEVLRAAYRFHEDRGYGPTVRDMKEILGFSGTFGVTCHRRLLVSKGLLLPPTEPQTARSSFLVSTRGAALIEGRPYDPDERPPCRRFRQNLGGPVDPRPENVAATAEHAGHLRRLLPGEIAWTLRNGDVSVHVAKRGSHG